MSAPPASSVTVTAGQRAQDKVPVLVILQGKQGGGGAGNGDGDEVVVIEDTDSGSEDYGQCLDESGSWVVWDGCSAPRDEWIEVPTGGSFALESEYYYEGDDRDYATATSLTSGAQIELEGAVSSEDYRTWYFPAA